MGIYWSATIYVIYLSPEIEKIFLSFPINWLWLHRREEKLVWLGNWPLNCKFGGSQNCTGQGAHCTIQLTSSLSIWVLNVNSLGFMSDQFPGACCEWESIHKLWEPETFMLQKKEWYYIASTLIIIFICCQWTRIDHCWLYLYTFCLQWK